MSDIADDLEWTQLSLITSFFSFLGRPHILGNAEAIVMKFCKQADHINR